MTAPLLGSLQRFDFLELVCCLLWRARLFSATGRKRWTSRCLSNILKSHGCDLNSDISDSRPMLNKKKCFEAKYWQRISRFAEISMCCKLVTWDSRALQELPPLAHLWTSRGERLRLWQCRLIWEALFLPRKQNTRGQNGELVWPPQHDSPGSWQGGAEPRIRAPPLHKYSRGRGSSGELTRSFHPREAHFRGMWLFPHRDRSLPPALRGRAEPWMDRRVPPDPFVWFWSCVSVHIASPTPDTAVGRSGRVSTHTALGYNPNTG